MSEDGPATNQDNKPVIDPTKNVDTLVATAVRRLDDLRENDNQHRQEIDHIRHQHAEDLRKAEAARIDAIRAVDIAAVQQASSVANNQAVTLAAQVATSAEALRTQVVTTANDTRATLTAALDPMRVDIADLRRSQYEAQGQKTQVVESRQSTAAVYALIGLIVTLILATITIVGVLIGMN